MGTVHVVAQGETLHRIAKKHGFRHWQTLYDHVDNAALRKKRPNPNLLLPGDEITIPEKEPLVVKIQTNQSHVFQMKPIPTEKFKVKIQNGSGKSWVGKKVSLKVGEQTLETEITETGFVEVDLPRGDEESGELSVFMNNDDSEPTHTFEIKLGYLDPIDTLSGVQARCNALNFPCGVVDGLMGQKTREGVMAFQETYSLSVDGKPGPKTQAKLQEVYGL